MTSPIADQLGITEDTDVVLVNPPAGIADVLRPLPDGARVRPAAVLFEQTTVPFTILFATEADVLRQQLGRVVETLPASGVVWLAWPSGTQNTALTAEAVRTIGAGAGLHNDDACDVGTEWTALRFVVPDAERPNWPASAKTVP